MAKTAEPFGLSWVEIDSYSPAALRDIRSRTSIPVASGEALFTRRQYAPYLTPPAMDVAIIDVPWNGLSESLKIAAMVEAAEMTVAPHNFCGPLSTVISAHFSGLIPNLRILEYDPDHVPWYDDLLSHPLPVKDGRFHLPDRPGWGFEVNEEALKRHPPRI
jgi:L-alanine-DL-glutamate epimerase-like enolase superfamily enzyme